MIIKFYLYRKAWHFAVFALLYTGAKFLLFYIECNGVTRDRV